MSEPAISYLLPGPADWRCCHCKGPVVTHLFNCGGHWLRSYHCPLCGDVIPVRAAPPATPLVRCEASLARSSEAAHAQ